MSVGELAQRIVDILSEDLDRGEHVTHPEESCDESAVAFFYPNEEDPEEEYTITVRRRRL